VNELIAKRLIALIEDSASLVDSDGQYYLIPIQSLDEIIDDLLGAPVLLPRDLIARVSALREKHRGSKCIPKLLKWERREDSNAEQSAPTEEMK